MKKIKTDSSILTLSKYKMAVGTILIITMLFVAFVLVPPVVAEEQTPSADTTFHHAIVNIVDGEILLEIQPLLLPEAGCVSCVQNQTCPSGNEPINITSAVLEEDESHTVVLLTYEVNGTTFEVTVAWTLLWSYEELTEVNRTGSFVSTEITAEDVSTQFYSLSYLVQHEEYNLTLDTILTPLNSETYNSSFTIINYAPAGKSEVTSLEFVEFNSTVTLSQQYAVLGKVAKEIGKVYEKSGNETLAKLAEGYYPIEEEAKGLSKLVEKQLQEYDREILTITAIIEDARIAVCIFGIAEAFRLIFYCLQPLAPTWVIVGACCAPLYAIFLGVLGTCIVSLGIACLIAIAAAVLLGWATLAGCYGYCPSMQACVNMCFLWWCWDVVCMQMW